MLKIIWVQNERFLFDHYWSWISYPLQPFMEWMMHSFFMLTVPRNIHYTYEMVQNRKMMTLDCVLQGPFLGFMDLYSMITTERAGGSFLPWVQTALAEGIKSGDASLHGLSFPFSTSMSYGQWWSERTVLYPAWIQSEDPMAAFMASHRLQW